MRFAFIGYWWDPYLKMYHVRHRVYDPTPGPGGMRWLQSDPTGFVDGWNLYAYCPNGFGVGDPVNGIDPLGLWGEQTATKWVNPGSAIGTAAGYVLGVVGGAAEGWLEGNIIQANELTFHFVEPLNSKAEQLIADGGAMYEAGAISSAIGREFAIWAATAGTGAVARGRIAGVGAIPRALSAVARNRRNVEWARNIVRGILAAEAISGGYQVGVGVHKVVAGDHTGWFDIATGTIGVSGGVSSYRGVKFYPDRQIQDHHVAAQNAHRAAPARRILERRAFDIDGDENRIFIPHKGSHPKEYYDWVNANTDRIDECAGSDEQFYRLFQSEVAEPIRRNPDCVRKVFYR